MLRKFCLALVFILLPAVAPGGRAFAQGAAATLTVTEKGVRIEAAGLGSSTLGYPKLVKQAGEYKIIGTDIAGSKATVKYEGGGQILVDASDSSKITYTYSGVPDDVKTLQTQMTVGFGEGPNRKWKFDGQAGEFPREKPAKPHLYQGHANTFTLTNFENRTIAFTVPENTYQQLTDAREWGQSAFFWTQFTPYIKDRKTLTVGIGGGAAGDVKKVVLIDKFGQSTQYDWPLKVKDDADLKADVESEKAYYASLKPPVADKFGGQPGSREKLGLRATGFFHTEKAAGRWLLVDPDGNAFFHLGVCVFGPGDDYTLVKGREGIYESLPPVGGELKTAYKPDQGSAVISFHLANQIRKYGEPYSLDAYTARMIERTRKMGFNSIGAFSAGTANPSAQKMNFPYAAHLPLGEWDAGIKSMSGTNVWDPFDAANRDKLDQSFARRLPARASDPLIIGYFLANEPLYEEIVKVVPGLKGTQAAKKRLVQLLVEKYGTAAAFNAAWNANVASLDELGEKPLIVGTKAAAADMQAYYGLFMETYFQLVTTTFHKYDQNHLLIGNRLQSGTINNEQLCRLMGKYLDVISFNYYTYTFDKAFLNRIHGWMGDKPMMLTEFYWSSPIDSGMGSRQDVSNQRERGLAYRNYVENAAALDYIVGIEWFTLVDQSVTGRWFSGFNGEAANTGLFSVTDRPWKPMIDEMAKTNYAIYDVWLRRQKPFVFNDPRFTEASGGKKTLSISRATGPMKIDGIADNWPGVPAEPISSSRLVVGNSANGLEASFKLCWDETNLYVLANIVDATPMKNSQAPASLWNGDGLELFIGSENLAGGGPLLFTDRQIQIGGGKSGQVYFGNAPQQYPAQTAVVPGVDGKGYTIEAALPWAALGVAPKDNLDLVFDLAVDDGSGGGRERQLMWNGTARNSGDRSYWGKAKLVR